MNSDKKTILIILLLNLLTMVLVLSLHNENIDSSSFQHLTCGFGLGGSINPRWGFNNFDPRVEWIEETNLFPVPAGYIYSPARTLSITDFKEGYLLK